MTLLADAIRGNLKSDPNGKDANLMRLLNATVDALVGDLQESSKLLQKVAAQAQKCRELLCARKEQITSILDSIPPDASKEAAHAALVAGMPEFALRAEALLSAASTGQALVAAVKKATDDSQALSDLEHIIGAIRGEHSDESVTYAPAQHFTDMLWALRGQCLDFRANRNSIGNFVYLPSYADRDRMVITAQDAQERALCNAPIALYVIDRAGEKMPAIILDKLYVPGGGIFKESQLTGYLDYARQLAALTGLPVVMPAFIFAGRPLSFEKAAAYFTGVRTIAATDEEVRIRITLGPSGSTYHEFVDFSFYGTETDVPVRALIIEAHTINRAKPEPAAAGAAAAP